MCKETASAPLSLSDQGPCQNGVIRKKGKQKPQRQKPDNGDNTKKQTWSGTSIDKGVWSVSMMSVRSSDWGPC